jgi:hypothetical protein
MSGCGGGCSTGNAFNPGGHYVGIRINENEDGRVVFCETNGTALDKGQASTGTSTPRWSAFIQ